MKQTKKLLEHEDLIGRDNLEKLISEYGGRKVYIPRTKKHDPRIYFLRTLQFMQGYFEEGQTIEQIAAENLLSEYQRDTLKRLTRYSKYRYIQSQSSLLSALGLVRSAESEKLLLLIGAGAFANLMEQYGGKVLIVPKAAGTEQQTKVCNTNTNILFDLMSGLSVEETAVKNKYGKSRVKNIYNMYCSDKAGKDF